MKLLGEQTYQVSDELYIVRVLNGFDMCGSALDNNSYIKSVFPILDDLKAINDNNINEFWEKGSKKEIDLFFKASKHIQFRKVISFGYYCELLNNALNANDGIYAHDIVHICAGRLTISNTGLRLDELEELVREYFKPEQVIDRSEIDEFTNYVLKRSQNDRQNTNADDQSV